MQCQRSSGGSAESQWAGNAEADDSNESPKWPTCITSGLNASVIGEVTIAEQKYFVRRMATIFEQAMDDYGTSAADDTLQIFCVSRNKDDRFGNIAMCLSGEKCPWRK